MILTSIHSVINSSLFTSDYIFPLIFSSSLSPFHNCFVELIKIILSLIVHSSLSWTAFLRSDVINVLFFICSLRLPVYFCLSPLDFHTVFFYSFHSHLYNCSSFVSALFLSFMFLFTHLRTDLLSIYILMRHQVLIDMIYFMSPFTVPVPLRVPISKEKVIVLNLLTQD